MDAHLRDFFDQRLERVLAVMPERVHRLLEEVPLHVEDYPSDEVMESTGIRNRRCLCGLYTGVPLTDRGMLHSGKLPDVVTIYREGILDQAADADGHLSEKKLIQQIRITLLHELGHHHGLEEEDLEELGYG